MTAYCPGCYCELPPDSQDDPRYFCDDCKRTDADARAYLLEHTALPPAVVDLIVGPWCREDDEDELIDDALERVCPECMRPYANKGKAPGDERFCYAASPDDCAGLCPACGQPTEQVGLCSKCKGEEREEEEPRDPTRAEAWYPGD